MTTAPLDALGEVRASAIDELMAAATELDWAETRALAAIEGAQRAGIPTSALIEIFDVSGYRPLQNLIWRLRRRRNVIGEETARGD